MSDTKRVWPLVFSYRGIVMGAGFEAIVDVACRVLAEEQDGNGGIWMNGAQPGGFAAGGDDIDSAHQALKTMFLDILRDTAEESESFEAFQGEMNRFFADIDRGVNAAWLKAWIANRKGELDCESLEWMMRVKGDETGSRVQVEQIHQVAAVEHPAPAAAEAPVRDRRRSEQEISRIAA